jgi:hypothetical protein
VADWAVAMTLVNFVLQPVARRKQELKKSKEEERGSATVNSGFPQQQYAAGLLAQDRL